MVKQSRVNECLSLIADLPNAILRELERKAVFSLKDNVNGTTAKQANAVATLIRENILQPAQA